MPISPNMSLPVPVVGQDTGYVWETSQNAQASILDGHNHTSGSGVQIPPAGLNINSALTFNNNPAVDLSSLVLTAQTSLSTLLAVYAIGPDLYFNDANGNVVQITNRGSVNSTSSGISSGTATAAFAAGVLVVNAASLTPADIKCGSVYLGNNVASSNYMKLSPPAAMATNYTVTLPLPPVTTLLMIMDSSGNMGTVANATIADTLGQAMTSVGANAIGATMTSTGANAVAASRTRAIANPAGVGGIAQASITSYSNATSTFSTISSVTLTTSGRPVAIALSPIVTTSPSPLTPGAVSFIGSAQAYQLVLQLLNSTSSAAYVVRLTDGAPTVTASLPPQTLALSPVGNQDLTSAGTVSTAVTVAGRIYSPGSFYFLDTPTAGTQTYTLSGAIVITGGSGVVAVSNVYLTAYEL